MKIEVEYAIQNQLGKVVAYAADKTFALLIAKAFREEWREDDYTIHSV